jgi:hypothetical protein
MPRTKTPVTPIQLDLFHEPPEMLTWNQLPSEVRAKTRILLARLLIVPRQVLPDAARDEEVRYE